MKYDEFRALCKREWDRDSGDVQALALTCASLAEFTRDVLTQSEAASSTVVLVREGETPVLMARNPVTISKVPVSGGAEADTATVRWGPGD